MCDYAVKLTLTPWDMAESDLEPMRAAGLSDREILDVNLIVCYFAYVNRLADGLGISLEGDDDVLGW
jgi:alkylhydroperoxidase family enzyme